MLLALLTLFCKYGRRQHITFVAITYCLPWQKIDIATRYTCTETCLTLCEF